MAFIFDPLEAEGLLETEKPFFDVLKSSLQFPSTPAVQAQRLSDDIAFFCSSAKADEDPGAILCMAWDMMFDMVSYIPPNHEWQDTWVDALKILQNRENLPPTGTDPRELNWKDLPDFAMKQRERFDSNMHEDTKRKNLVSFYARLYASGVTETPHYPIWGFRYSLESYDSSESVPETDIWITTEWMIRCADKILDFIKQSDEPEEDSSLCFWGFGDKYAGKEKEGVGLLTIERWNLWKKWLSEKKEKLSESGSETFDSVSRLSEALKKINEAEGRS